MQESKRKHTFIKIGSWKLRKDHLNSICLFDHRRLRTKLIKRLAARISDKRGKKYAHVMGFIAVRGPVAEFVLALSDPVFSREQCSPGNAQMG